ncbi:MAG: trigger factor [Gammaproteobacteria bacterium]|nr:MAG: trigger factor [Gammaproteobacteria bacterium]
MQVSIETTSGLERRLTVGVPAERIDSEVTARLKKAAGNVRLDGFRPGKVPMNVLRQRFGAGVHQEVVGELIGQSFAEAVTQEDLKPAGQPTIEPKTMEQGKDLEYVAVFEVFPEIELASTAGMKVERPVAEVTDADIDDMIEIFRKQQGSMEEVERPAQHGDTVNIDYKGTKDGEEFAGGSAEDTDLELGSGRMIAGFEDGIEGMSAGDEKTLELSFPEDYHAEELKGAAVEFAVKLNSVKEQKLAALDDELFAKYGVEEGGEERFRADIRDNMSRELRNAVKAATKAQVMNGLLAAHESLEVPAALIAQEVDNLRGQMFQQFGGSAPEGLDLKSILPDDMFTERAGKRVRLGLLMNEFIKSHELETDNDRVDAQIKDLASTYEDPQEVIDYYHNNAEMLQGVQAMVLEDQVVDKLLADADVTDKPVSYQEAMAAAQQAQANN